MRIPTSKRRSSSLIFLLCCLLVVFLLSSAASSPVNAASDRALLFPNAVHFPDGVVTDTTLTVLSSSQYTGNDQQFVINFAQAKEQNLSSTTAPFPKRLVFGPGLNRRGKVSIEGELPQGHSIEFIGSKLEKISFESSFRMKGETSIVFVDNEFLWDKNAFYENFTSCILFSHARILEPTDVPPQQRSQSIIVRNNRFTNLKGYPANEERNWFMGLYFQDSIIQSPYFSLVATNNTVYCNHPLRNSVRFAKIEAYIVGATLFNVSNNSVRLEGKVIRAFAHVIAFHVPQARFIKQIICHNNHFTLEYYSMSLAAVLFAAEKIRAISEWPTFRFEHIDLISFCHNSVRADVYASRGSNTGHGYAVTINLAHGLLESRYCYPGENENHFAANISRILMNHNSITANTRDAIYAAKFVTLLSTRDMGTVELSYNYVESLLYADARGAEVTVDCARSWFSKVTVNHNVVNISCPINPLQLWPGLKMSHFYGESPYDSARIVEVYLNMMRDEAHINYSFADLPNYPDEAGAETNIEIVNNSGTLVSDSPSLVMVALFNMSYRFGLVNVSGNYGNVTLRPVSAFLFNETRNLESGANFIQVSAATNNPVGRIVVANTRGHLRVEQNPDTKREAVDSIIGLRFLFQHVTMLRRVELTDNVFTINDTWITQGAQSSTSCIDVTFPRQCEVCEVRVQARVPVMGPLIISGNQMYLGHVQQCSLFGCVGVTLSHVTGVHAVIGNVTISNNTVVLDEIVDAPGNAIAAFSLSNVDANNLTTGIVAVGNLFDIAFYIGKATFVVNGAVAISDNTFTLQRIHREFSVFLFLIFPNVLTQIDEGLVIARNNASVEVLPPSSSSGASGASSSSGGACVFGVSGIFGMATLKDKKSGLSVQGVLCPKIEYTLGPPPPLLSSSQFQMATFVAPAAAVFNTSTFEMIDNNIEMVGAVAGVFCTMGANLSVGDADVGAGAGGGTLDLSGGSLTVRKIGSSGSGAGFFSFLRALDIVVTQMLVMSFGGEQPQHSFASSIRHVNITNVQISIIGTSDAVDLFKLYRGDFSRDPRVALAIRIGNDTSIVLSSSSSSSSLGQRQQLLLPSIVNIMKDISRPSVVATRKTPIVGDQGTSNRFYQLDILIEHDVSIVLDRLDKGSSSSSLSSSSAQQPSPFQNIPADRSSVVLSSGVELNFSNIVGGNIPLIDMSATSWPPQSASYLIWTFPWKPTSILFSNVQVNSAGNTFSKIVHIPSTAPPKPLSIVWLQIPLVVKCFFWNSRRLSRFTSFVTDDSAADSSDLTVNNKYCGDKPSLTPTKTRSVSPVPDCAQFSLSYIGPRRPTVKKLLYDKTLSFVAAIVPPTARDTRPPVPQRQVFPTQPPLGSVQAEAWTIFRKGLEWNTSASSQQQRYSSSSSFVSASALQFQPVQEMPLDALKINSFATTSPTALRIVLDLADPNLLSLDRDLTITIRVDAGSLMACNVEEKITPADEENNAQQQHTTTRYADITITFARDVPEVSTQLLAFSQGTARFAMVATAGTSGPMVAQNMARSLMLGRYVDCMYDASENPLAFELSPLGLSFGRSKGRFLRGAVVGNGLVLFMFLGSIALLIYVWLYSRDRRRKGAFLVAEQKRLDEEHEEFLRKHNSKDEISKFIRPPTAAKPKKLPSTLTWKKFKHAMYSVGSVEMALAIMGILLSGSVSSSVTLILYGPEESRSSDILLGVLCIGFHILVGWWMFNNVVIELPRRPRVVFFYNDPKKAARKAAAQEESDSPDESEVIKFLLHVPSKECQSCAAERQKTKQAASMRRKAERSFRRDKASSSGDGEQQQQGSAGASSFWKKRARSASLGAAGGAAVNNNKSNKLSAAAAAGNAFEGIRREASISFVTPSTSRSHSAVPVVSSRGGRLLLRRDSSSDLTTAEQQAFASSTSQHPLLQQRSRAASFTINSGSGVFGPMMVGEVRDVTRRTPCWKRLAPYAKAFFQHQGYWKLAKASQVDMSKDYLYQQKLKQEAEAEAAEEELQAQRRSILSPSSASFSLRRSSSYNLSDARRAQQERQTQQEAEAEKNLAEKKEQLQMQQKDSSKSDYRWLQRCQDCFRDCHDRGFAPYFLTFNFWLIFVLAVIEGYVPSAKSSACKGVGTALAILNSLPLGVVVAYFPFRHWMMNAYCLLAGVAITFQALALCATYLTGDYEIRWLTVTSTVMQLVLQLAGSAKMLLDVLMVFFESPYFVIYIGRRLRHMAFHNPYSPFLLMSAAARLGLDRFGRKMDDEKKEDDDDRRRLLRQRNNNRGMNLTSLEGDDDDDNDDNSEEMKSSQNLLHPSSLRSRAAIPSCWDVGGDGSLGAGAAAAASAASTTKSPSSSSPAALYSSPAATTPTSSSHANIPPRNGSRVRQSSMAAVTRRRPDIQL